MWSEKSGCTAIVKWFFWQLDLLDEAVKHHPWVHNYENDVFKKRPGYTHDYLKAINDGLPVLKFVSTDGLTAAIWRFVIRRLSNPRRTGQKIIASGSWTP